MNKKISEQGKQKMGTTTSPSFIKIGFKIKKVLLIAHFLFSLSTYFRIHLFLLIHFYMNWPLENACNFFSFSKKNVQEIPWKAMFLGFINFEIVNNQSSTLGKKIKKVQAKKLIKWNESISLKNFFWYFPFSESKIQIFMENV